MGLVQYTLTGPYAPCMAMYGIFIPTKLGDLCWANVGIHIPAPWFADGWHFGPSPASSVSCCLTNGDSLSIVETFPAIGFQKNTIGMLTPLIFFKKTIILFSKLGRVNVFLSTFPGNVGGGFTIRQPTWWLIPLSKWVITPVISELTLLIPFIIGVITHLLSGMSHQVHYHFSETRTWPTRSRRVLRSWP